MKADQGKRTTLSVLSAMHQATPSLLRTSRATNAIAPTVILSTVRTLNLQQYLSEHMRYVIDVRTEQENKTTNAIDGADCRAVVDRLN